MKHVGSVVSMTAVPSDYYDESDRRVSYSSPQWTPKGPVYTTQSQPMARTLIFCFMSSLYLSCFKLFAL